MNSARWIWGGDESPRPTNAFRLFRREFELATEPVGAGLCVSAEWRYKLYINGEFVQIGPTPCQPAHRLFDRHDVSQYLKQGTNCIAFVVYCPGIMTGQWSMVNPGLLAELNVDDGRVLVGTDSDWQTIHAGAWRHPTQVCGYAKGFHEWHVVDEMPSGWTEPGFDAEEWEPALELPFFASGDPSQLSENYVGYPTLVEHLPSRFVHVGLRDGIVTEKMRADEQGGYIAVRNRWNKLMGNWMIHDLNQPLSDDEPLPEPVATRAWNYGNDEAVLANPVDLYEAASTETGLPMTVRVSETGHPFVAFDMGVVQSGLLMLEIESASGGTVDVGWDDRIDDRGCVMVNRATPNSDRVVVPPGKVKWEGFFERGLRYLQIILRDFTGDVIIHRVGVRETLTPVLVAQPATFESDNDLLNRIWKASVDTTRQYMTGCASGDPIRERCHWFHDDTMAMRMAFYCFGESRSWKRALELTAQSQHTDGFFPVISPGNFEDYNIVSGSCYWALQVAEYHRHTADAEFAERMIPHIQRHIDYELRFADSQGLLFETPGRRCLSWADGDPRTPYNPGETWAKTSRKTWGDFFDPPTRGYNAIINTYWLWCLREVAGLFENLGHASEADKCRRIYDTAIDAFESKFWESETGLYRDNLKFGADGALNQPTFCESTLFLMMRAGIIDQTRGLECLRTIMQPDFVCCRTSGGLDLSALPVFLIESGNTDEALEFYLDRWGSPVLGGATTAGEEFFRGGGNSDCHIHGATPARDFLEYLAGIRIMAPGWKEVLFAPPVDSPALPELKASVPTPQGSIEVAIERRNGSTVYSYQLPEGCAGFIRTAKGIEPLQSRRGETPLRSDR